jgi:hypothetical protein
MRGGESEAGPLVRAREEAKAGAGEPGGSGEAPRRRFELEDRGFDEVPPKYRKYYRRWEGPGDVLGPNEILCPICKVVIRSSRELRAGDALYCMCCFARLLVVKGAEGRLEAQVRY